MTPGRNPDGGTELDSGTTTIGSWGDPAMIRSTETTIAGRFLPGSPGLAAPNDTSHTSPRRGSDAEAIVEIDAVFEGGLPQAPLLLRRRVVSFGENGLPLGLEGLL